MQGLTRELADVTVRERLRHHPRVAYQGLLRDAVAPPRLADAMPTFVPFSGEYRAMVGILDWDHRLPSRALVLRLYAYCSTAAISDGERALEERLVGIAHKDRFPEFDVPDFEGLAADEAYEAAVTLDGQLGEFRLVSPWRRDVTPKDGSLAVETARRSDAFRQVRSETTGRPPHLGDLEAVGWCPPCESQHDRWTLDVWYLTAFDGQVGKGRSLLVDPADRKVVTVREFSIRAG